MIACADPTNFTMPKARTVKQLQIQKAKLAKKLLSRQKPSNAHVRFYTGRILALNYQICKVAGKAS